MVLVSRQQTQVSRRNEYQPKGGDALRQGSKGRYGSYMGGRLNCVIPSLHTAISERLSNGVSQYEGAIQITRLLTNVGVSNNVL